MSITIVQVQITLPEGGDPTDPAAWRGVANALSQALAREQRMTTREAGAPYLPPVAPAARCRVSWWQRLRAWWQRCARVRQEKE